MTCKINIRKMQDEARRLVVALGMAKRLSELKERSKTFPGTKPMIKRFEQSIGIYVLNNLSDPEQRVFFDLMALPIGKMLWVEWLRQRQKTYPHEVSILRYIFEHSLPIPNYLDDPKAQSYLEWIIQSEKLELTVPWWHALDPPLSTYALDYVSSSLCSVDGPASFGFSED